MSQNPQVRSLTISCERSQARSLYDLQREIDSLSLGRSSRSLQMLTDEDGKPLYPITPRLTEENFLKVLHDDAFPPVSQLVEAFSAVTELTFVTDCAADFEHLVKMLEEYPRWRGQLTSLTLIDNNQSLYPDLLPELNDRLFALINTDMPALERFSIKWLSGLKMVRNLSVIAQLKVLSAECINDKYFIVFLRSLYRYSEDAVGLQVILNSFPSPEIFDILSPYFSQVVVRIDKIYFDNGGRSSLIRIFFPSLTSVSLSSSLYNLAFSLVIFSKLTKLVHLDLSISQVNYVNLENLSWEKRPVIYNNLTRPEAVFGLVRALDLELIIADHDLVDWLNFGNILPNVEVIHLKSFTCECCQISLNKLAEYKTDKLATAFECLRTVLPQIHTRGSLPLSRILLDLPDYPTAEKVMANE